MTDALKSAIMSTSKREESKPMNKRKKSKKDKDLLKFLAGVRGEERPTMPRPVVFKDKKKYSRQRDKRVDFD